MNGEKLLTPQEVAQRLSISKRTVLRLAAQGKIPAVKFGPRLLRFEAERIDRWLHENYSRPRRPG